jgi:hypothetical protein
VAAWLGIPEVQSQPGDSFFDVLLSPLSLGRAHEHVKKIRYIANPNAGFIAQLLMWRKKLDKVSSNVVAMIDLCERVQIGSDSEENYLFHINRHSSDYPQFVFPKIAKLAATSLQPDGCFVLQTSTCLYLWKGDAATEELVTVGRQLVAQLQRYERVRATVKELAKADDLVQLLESSNGGGRGS